ncbi:hypothetical protein [Wenzhouxiangella sp. EGI_FJ10305]
MTCDPWSQPRREGLTATFDWQDIDAQAETGKRMQFLIKRL